MKTVSDDPSRYYQGIPAIAQALGKSEPTIWRWIHYHALPACKLPCGRWFTSDGLIDLWIVARAEAQRYARQSSQNRS